MKTLTSGALAAIASGHVALVQLVRMAFPSGVEGLNTSNYPITYAGTSYKGAAGLGSISTVQDSPGEIKGLQLTLDAGPAAIIALALDDADQVQGTVLEIRDALVDTANTAGLSILDAPMAWAGTLDTMSISEDGQQATVSVSAESRAVDLLRGNPLTFSDADQQSLYPGDLAFQYVTPNAGKPIVWPSREYFFK